MARKVKTVVIDQDGRDKGKHFLLTEMAAMQAEKWAMRALLALGQSGIDIPDDIAETGMAAIAAFGIKTIASVEFEAAAPLMDEMLECVTIIPDPSKPNVTRNLIEDDIEEVKTLALLRGEVLELHTGFSIAAELSKLREAAKASTT
jgi:hypothetical protein